MITRISSVLSVILKVVSFSRLIKWIGTLETVAPVYFRNQPLGCTATIIYQMYQEKGVEIPKNIAGLMMAAIISDTAGEMLPVQAHLTCHQSKEALSFHKQYS